MMKLSRPSRIFAAFIMLVSMLFTQLAVASYVCPGVFAKVNVSSSVMKMVAEMDMSGCTGTDLAQPNLCHAYDKPGHQSLDKPDLPVVETFLPSAMQIVLVLSDERFGIDARPQQWSLLLSRTTAPPLSIRNCCFRI